MRGGPPPWVVEGGQWTEKLTWSSQRDRFVGWRHYFSPSGVDCRRSVWACGLFGVVLSDLGPCNALQQAHGTTTVSSFFSGLLVDMDGLCTDEYSIIRILLMVPIYSLVGWLSIFFHKHAVYYSVMGDCYEAFTIAAFFALMCHYIAPDLHSQKNYFRGIKPKQWVWPIPWLQKCTGGAENGIWRIPRSGLTWFNV